MTQTQRHMKQSNSLPLHLNRRRFVTLAALAVPVAAAACGAKPTAETRVSTRSQPPPTTAVVQLPTTPTVPDREPSDWGTDLAGIISTVAVVPGTRTMALTFDACGGSGGSALDRGLISTLREFAVPATLFLNERWIRNNHDDAARLTADPLFQIENHGSLHVPLSVTGRAAYGIRGTMNPTAVVDEIDSNRELLKHSLGVKSIWFRAGTAHYDDVAIEIAHSLGLRIAGFAVNADSGATSSPATVRNELLEAPDGAIVLAHANQPRSGTSEGIRSALTTLTAQGCRFVHLDTDSP